MKSCDEGLFPTASGWNDVTRGGSYGKAREARSSAFPESNVLVLSEITALRREEAVLNGIELIAGSREGISALEKTGEKLAKKAKIHIAIDSGMGRNGFLANENLNDVFAWISGLKNIEVRGIATHLSCAETPDKTHDLGQLERFDKALSLAESNNIRPYVVHALASAALAKYSNKRYDMVRCGMILYGLMPDFTEHFNDLGLEEAFSLRLRVMNVRKLPKGSTVGYDANFTAEREMEVATVNFGTADGLSNRKGTPYSLSVKGRKVDILGNICLSNFMFDASGLDLKAGDVISLFGRDGSYFLSCEALAKHLGMSSVELLSKVGINLKRVYVTRS